MTNRKLWRKLWQVQAALIVQFTQHPAWNLS
jgi:hypothetical protein